MESPEARTKLGNCMIFMSHYVRRLKRVLLYLAFGHPEKSFTKFSTPSFSLFYFASSIKTRPEANWNNLKNTPENYFRSVVFLHPQPCFSSYSLVIYGRTEKRE